MPLPKKFKELLESGPAETPDYVWMVYTVCGVERESCGWHGWALESAVRAGEPSAKSVESDDRLRCPNCGRLLYRTDDGLRFDRAPQQPVFPKLGMDYTVEEPTYLDDDDPAWDQEESDSQEDE
jgi:hypothetical protein